MAGAREPEVPPNTGPGKPVIDFLKEVVEIRHHGFVRVSRPAMQELCLAQASKVGRRR